MSQERIEGRVRKKKGKAEEDVGKDLDDKEMESRGKADKEYGKAEEKGRQENRERIPAVD